MAYQSTDARIGAQALASTSTVQNHPVLTRTKGNDPSLGEGEFIYLKGLASTAAGDAVTWDEAGVTTRYAAATRGPVGVAMSANVANQWGWYQIRGVAVANAVAGVAEGNNVMTTATTGSLGTGTTAGQGIGGARWQSAVDTPSTGKAYLSLDGAFADGRTNVG